MAWRLTSIDVPEILDALNDELEETRDAVIFTVEAKEREENVWKIRVKHDEKRREPLDESFEGQAAWWPGPPKGAADVLSVLPEELQINLRFATQEPPGPGQQLFVYAPRYLKALEGVWEDFAWARRCDAWLDQSIHHNAFDAAEALSADGAPFPLRAAQRAAFALTGWRVGFLWGPPGTEKTYTLGALLATYMVDRPRARVLLMSTTNSAVDQMLVSVDDALSKYGAQAQTSRRQCQRVGNHFIGARYVAREHLLPVPSPELVRELSALEAGRPDPANVAAYANWKSAVEGIRRMLREKARHVLESARLAAITTTAAAFLMETLREQRQYDLLVFDEASQVGLAHALALAPLAKRVIFAGDPCQLLPIVQSKRDAPARWLGESMFVSMNDRHASTCFLNEQSRMVEPICSVVSGTFYRSKLVVAADAQKDREWLGWRALGGGAGWRPPHICLESDLEPGTWSPRYGGPIRFSSTVWLIHSLPGLLDGVDEQHVIVLTPFRAQRALVRKRLREAGFRGVRVSTIHRAQGSEEHTVIFDPVDGSSGFFDLVGERLINVALSRAQARLVLLFSAQDLINPKLRQIADFVRIRTRTQSEGSADDAPPITAWIGSPDFPGCIVGRILRVGAIVGEVREAGRTDIVLQDVTTGEVRRFKTDVVVSRFGQVPSDGTASVDMLSVANRSAPPPPGDNGSNQSVPSVCTAPRVAGSLSASTRT